jgi:uncharacterized membrane protein (DUF485 family)
MNQLSTQDDENVTLGMALTALQVMTYLCFVAACCFAPGFIQGQTLSNGVPLSFAIGLGVISLGVILTIVYVAITNRVEGAK